MPSFNLGSSFATRYPNLVDQDEIIRVLRAFEASGLEYVLIGSAAMGFQGVVRATEDLDLLVRATSENIRFRIHRFRSQGPSGTKVNVATPLALYRLKKGTLRTQDHADAAALRERFNLRDED